MITPPWFETATAGGPTMKPKEIEWDGTHVPQALRELPPGRYAVEPIDNVPPLTLEEDAGIVDGLDQLMNLAE